MLTLLLLLACSTPHAPTPAEDLSWLVGPWTTERDGFRTTEWWHAMPDGSLLGSGSVRSGQVLVAAETLSLSDAPDGTRAYTAWPEGQAPQTFRLVTMDGTSVTVAREGDDFPIRITYRRASQSSLEVIASGTGADGAPRVDTWSLDRMVRTPSTD